MTCTRCERDVRASSSFCPYCGEPVRSSSGTERVDQDTPAAAHTEVLSLPRPSATRRPTTSPFARQPEPSVESEPPTDRPGPTRSEPSPHWSAAEAGTPEHRGASPASRVTSAPPTSPPAHLPPGPTGGSSRLDPPDRPRPGTTSRRSLADGVRSWPVEAIGAGVVVGLALIKTMPAFAVSLTEDASYPKGAVVTLLLLTVLAVGVAAAGAVLRVTELRRAGRTTPPTVALVAGGAVFVTAYGLLVTLIAALTDDARALLLLF